jgi:hypothetical protein
MRDDAFAFRPSMSCCKSGTRGKVKSLSRGSTHVLATTAGGNGMNDIVTAYEARHCFMTGLTS